MPRYVSDQELREGMVGICTVATLAEALIEVALLRRHGHAARFEWTPSLEQYWICWNADQQLGDPCLSKI